MIKGNMGKAKFLIIALLLSSALYAQEAAKYVFENPRVKRPVGLSFNLGGPALFASVSLDYFVLPVLNVEAGGGVWGYYTGPKFHFKGNTKKDVTLYTGVLVTAYPPLPGASAFYDAGWNVSKPKTHYYVYVPIGLNNISKNGYTTSIEIATSNAFIEWKVPIIFSLKFGYHFNKN
ncbi:MAG: hypothetical protein Q7U87_00055 [bacterium]|nr:hypothetical protein [bacterium]